MFHIMHTVHNVKHHSYDVTIGCKFQLETCSNSFLDAYMSRSIKRHLVELFIFVKHRYFLIRKTTLQTVSLWAQILIHKI